MTACVSAAISNVSEKSWHTKSAASSLSTAGDTDTFSHGNRKRSYHTACHCYYPACRTAAAPGFINYFDRAENAFVSAYRKYIDADNFDIHIEYIASPRLDGKTLILVDPMLATGGSMELAYKALLTKGEPAHIHIASVIASRQAVEHVQKYFLRTKQQYGVQL